MRYTTKNIMSGHVREKNDNDSHKLIIQLDKIERFVGVVVDNPKSCQAIRTKKTPTISMTKKFYLAVNHESPAQTRLIGRLTSRQASGQCVPSILAHPTASPK